MTILELLRLGPVVPVIAIEREEQAVPLARALVAGGVRVLEVTLRTDVALEAVARIGSEVEDAIVGVGTITRSEDVVDALAAGARFGVSPGMTAELAESARTCALPLLPGVMTPSDIIAAVAAGFRELKLFPARQAGGVEMLKALTGPFPDVLFCPTGGITPDTAPEYLALPNVACVGGSWLTPRDAVDRGDWQAVTRLAQEAAALGPSR